MNGARYVRLWSDPSGESHFTDEALPATPIGDVGTAAPMAAEAWAIRVAPPGWERDWGPAAHPTVAVYLTGQAEIEASDGEVLTVRPGVVLLAEDTTGRGHRVRVTSPEPVTVVLIRPA